MRITPCWPISISYAASSTLPADTWNNPELTGLQVLQVATDALYAASTASLLTERQCKRLLGQLMVAARAFAIMVRQVDSATDVVLTNPGSAQPAPGSTDPGDPLSDAAKG
jgi:hypothetical protein